MSNFECDCSEEYGPCEEHGEILVSREGSSGRSADQLVSTFIDDAVSLGAELSPYGKDVVARANEAFGKLGPFESWLEDADLAEELRTVADQVETELYTLGLSVYWEDGYTIVRITGGPLSGEGEGE
jgi:hypothetical protein